MSKLSALNTLKTKYETLLSELEAVKIKYKDDYPRGKSKIESILEHITEEIAKESAIDAKQDLGKYKDIEIKRLEKTKQDKIILLKKDLEISENLREFIFQL